MLLIHGFKECTKDKRELLLHNLMNSLLQELILVDLIKILMLDILPVSHNLLIFSNHLKINLQQCGMC
jgi:hypothetical protein